MDKLKSLNFVEISYAFLKYTYTVIQIKQNWNQDVYKPKHSKNSMNQKGPGVWDMVNKYGFNIESYLEHTTWIFQNLLTRSHRTAPFQVVLVLTMNRKTLHSHWHIQLGYNDRKL